MEGQNSWYEAADYLERTLLGGSPNSISPTDTSSSADIPFAISPHPVDDDDYLFELFADLLDSPEWPEVRVSSQARNIQEFEACSSAASTVSPLDTLLLRATSAAVTDSAVTSPPSLAPHSAPSPVSPDVSSSPGDSDASANADAASVSVSDHSTAVSAQSSSRSEPRSQQCPTDNTHQLTIAAQVSKKSTLPSFQELSVMLRLPVSKLRGTKLPDSIISCQLGGGTCSRLFVCNVEGLRDHLSTYHVEQSGSQHCLVQNEDGEYLCSWHNRDILHGTVVCGRRLKSWATLLRHISEVHRGTEGAVQCALCDRIISRPGHPMVRHLVSVHLKHLK